MKRKQTKSVWCYSKRNETMSKRYIIIAFFSLLQMPMLFCINGCRSAVCVCAVVFFLFRFIFGSTLRLPHNGFSHLVGFGPWPFFCNRLWWICIFPLSIFFFRDYIISMWCLAGASSDKMRKLFAKNVINVLKICRAYTFHLGHCSCCCDSVYVRFFFRVIVSACVYVARLVALAMPQKKW